MIKPSTQREIALVCYAGVLGAFADLHRPRYEQYDWTHFVDFCVSQSYTWMQTSYHGLKNDEVKARFEQYAREIAQTALDRKNGM